ncbi:hypothetical protein HDV00_007443 [Rhizophlyctis rosea]|nr:hypothetical protein HDV00_007443 [Rhizophlyctis rosea]
MHISALSTLLVAATLFGQSQAHYRFYQLIANGQTYPQWQYIRQYDNINSRSPITSVTSNDIRCNLNGASKGSGVGVVSVAPGSTVGFVADGAVYHPGPYSAWLGKAPGDVTQWDGSGANWFKIWEKAQTGVTSSGLQWDTTSSQVTFKIPSATPPGQYLLRIEQIGLHSAGSAGGAQFYISCAHIQVTGSGSGNPSKVSLPGAYKATDPGLLINLYYPVPTSYTPAGPAPWSG